MGCPPPLGTDKENAAGQSPSPLDKVKQLEKELQAADKALKSCPSSVALAIARKDVEAALEESRRQMRDAKDPGDQLRSKADRAANHPARLKKD